jgi:uncharacterized protein (TIGR03435 family)
MEDDRYDIEARPESPATREQMLLMLQSLLSERFQLAFHRETKPLPVNALVVAKGGPKFGAQFHPLKAGEQAYRFRQGSQRAPLSRRDYEGLRALRSDEHEHVGPGNRQAKPGAREGKLTSLT